jgi:hypothetical protein
MWSGKKDGKPASRPESKIARKTSSQTDGRLTSTLESKPERQISGKTADWQAGITTIGSVLQTCDTLWNCALWWPVIAFVVCPEQRRDERGIGGEKTFSPETGKMNAGEARHRFPSAGVA